MLTVVALDSHSSKYQNELIFLLSDILTGYPVRTKNYYVPFD